NIEDFDNLNQYSGSVVLGEGANQSVYFLVEDLAGNVLDTRMASFKPHYAFNDDITISTNVFVRWYANKTLFRLSLVGLLLVCAGIILLLVKRKKKKDETTNLPT
ncbi:MAG TPA: hypothetical protein GX717_01805, partial [Clostridiaceae bacterium]|nr:hypothetical protein [Clostridiaceae bacterium]